MQEESWPLREKALTGYSRFFLFLCAGGVILLAYASVMIFVLALLALLACELAILVVLARFWLAGLITDAVAKHADLLVVFFRSFWLRRGVEYRVALPSQDAPQLFEMVKALCHKAQVAMPTEISLQTGVTAWVRLDGFRRGVGRTVLGVGVDLLAGLSRWELKGVLAHEVAHAKLIQRGYNKWLNRGLSRIIQLARGLHALVEVYRQKKQRADLSAACFRGVDWLARTAARCVAGCSRQNEFDADRGAAALCGAGAIRSSLIRLEHIAEQSARIPWNERVARLQSGQGFAAWLVAELTSDGMTRARQAKQDLFSRYSTHPSLSDRLAALPEDLESGPPDVRPAIFLLGDPDKAVENLMADIQRKIAEEERKDSRRLRRFTRRGMHRHLRPLQSAGVLLLTAGLVIGVITWLVAGFSGGLGWFIAGTVGLGCAGYWLGRFRERLALPVPGFALLKSAWENKPDISETRIKALEKELREKAGGLNKAGRERLFTSLAYEALGGCDYVRAHVGARFALEANNKSVEGAISVAVAGAALGQVAQVHQALHFVESVTGMVSPSANWGAGWALALCGDWAPAEAFLEKASRQNLKVPTVLLLQALSQSNRGKLHSAMQLAEQACAMPPGDKEHEKVHLDLLLSAGYLRAAESKLTLLKSYADDDLEIMLSMVWWNLLSRNFVGADEWVERMKARRPSANMFVRLGRYFEVARQESKAAGFYQESLQTGFYPESLLGLARLEAKAQKVEEARRLLASALNTERSLGEKAVGPLPLFPQITGLLLTLEDPLPDCRAWIASMNGGQSPKALANRSLLIYAKDRPSAHRYLASLISALAPGLAPIKESSVGWSEARPEQQPDGPVHPGVQCVLN